MSAIDRWDSKVQLLSHEEGRDKLNRITTAKFDMTWDEFISAFDAGDDIPGEHTEIMAVVTLRSFAGG